MEDNYSKLYKAMVNSGYDTADLGGSEDDFRREMQDSTTRKNFYDWVSNNEMNGFRIGSYDAYEERLAPNEATAPQAVAAPQLEADKSAYTFTAEELGIEESNGNAPAAPVELQYDGTKPVVPGMAKEGDIPGIDMEAYNANMAKAMAEGKVLSPQETQRRFEEREAEVAARLPQARAAMSQRMQQGQTMQGAFDRAYDNYRDNYPTIEAERLTSGLFDKYAKEREDVQGKVKEVASTYNSATKYVAAPHQYSVADPYTVASVTAKGMEADDLNLIEGFIEDAREEILTNEKLKAEAEENAQALGLELHKYVDEVAVPMLQERMYKEWIEPQEEEIKEDYMGIMSAFDNSIIGMLANIGRTDTEKYLKQVGQEEWRKNASLWKKAAAGAGSMIFDLPIFGGIGSLASKPAQALGQQVFKGLAKRETARQVAKGATKEAAQRYANYAVRNGLKNRILLNLSTAPLQSGLTFGVFDAGKTALNMSLGGEWDWGELGKSAAGGTLLGGALGVTSAVGSGLTYGLTGPAKYAGKVAEFGVENAVFTEGGRLIGKLHGEQPENGWLEDYVESGVTLLMIKAPNIAKNVSRIKGDKEASEVFSFNKLEREQLGKYGEDLNAVLESLLPQSAKLYEDGLKINEGTFTEEYRRVMSDPEVSMTTKAKLMGIVEGKMMPAPRVVDAQIEGNRVMTYDPMGQLVEVKEYATKTKAEAEYKKAADKAEIESIAVLEDVYMRIKGYEADELTVKEWLAKNPKVTMERVAEIVAKNSAGEKLTEAEQKILESLRQARREGLNDVRHLNDVLAGLDVDAKDVMSGLDKPIDKRTERENRAVRAYTDVLFREVKDKIQEPYRRGEAQRAADDVWRAANNVKWANEDVKLLADRIYESDRQIDETANDGMVYTTTTPSGEKIIITGGKVVLDNEGYIDVNQSEGLVALMPDGTKKPVRPGDLREKVEVSNAEEMKAAKREEIKQEVAAEPIAESGEVAKNEVLTYEEGGETHSIEVLGDNGDGTSRIISDGQEKIIGNDLLESLRGAQGIVEAQKGENAEKVVESSPTGEEAAPVVEAPAQTELPKEKQAVASIPTEKKGKEERAAYHLVPIERTMEDLHDGTLEPDEIVGLIDARIKEAENDVKNVEKKKPVIGADKNAYVAAKQQWQADMEAAKAKLDYYNQLKAINAEVTRSEMREAVEAVEPQVLIEQTPDEFVANQLGGFIKITPESFQKETGLKTEQKQMVGVIAGKDKGGVSIERAAEIILENYGDELRGLGFNGDMQDMRDMIINILSNGNPRSYAKKGAEMRAQESVDGQMSQLESIAIGMGFKDTDEMIAYEEAVAPRIIQDYTGFDETEYFNNLAENIKYDTTRESEGTRRGSELLQGEQSADNAGTGNIAEPGQGGEIQGDVYSGGENAAPQGNQQVSSSEFPNNQNRDNVSPVEGAAEGGNAPGQSGVDPRNMSYDERAKRGDIYVADAEFEQEKQSTQSVGEQVQAAEAEVNTTPTDAQKEAGNYKKGHVKIGPFNISIEQPKGSVRSGVDKGGKKWEVEMQNTYGYIRGTEGVDGDHIDVFLSNDIDGWDGRQVFVVDQRNADGSFDEHKVMLGFNDINDAEAAYMSNYEEGWQGLGTITGVSIEEFEKWLSSSHRKTKAFAEYKNIKTDEGQSTSAESGVLLSDEVADAGPVLDKKAEQEKAAAKQKVKDAIEPFAKEKAAEQATIKIEDVGEKIGGARKDVIRKYADKIKLDGKTFGTMFPKPEIDQLVEAGLPLDRVAAVKAMFDNAKREYERTKKRMGKDKALSASLFYAMYAKNVLNGETDNFDLKYNGWVFTDWGKEYMKANIALYRAVFEKLGAEYGKMDLAKYAITPLDAQHKKMLNLKALNESNARMQALRAKEKGEEPPVYKDGDLINFVGENHARPSDQFETLEEAVNAMVERIGKEVKPGAEALYKPEVYWKTDERGRADYSKIFVGVKVRGFGTVDLMEFKSSNEARQWLDEHGDDFQQMAAAKEVQVKAENKKPLPKYSIEYTLDRVNSQYAVVANFGRGKVHTLRTFDFPEDDARARMSVFKDEVMPFLNSQEAVQAANEYAEELQQKKSAPKNVVVEKNSRERVGVDWRNGQDATTEMFVDVEGKEPSVFGFRALEFGNYVSQKERQQYLNDIYDALMDMSEVLGVSPRALSLGGKLALAVGARGISGASGHYEPYKNVINITKTKGAGVLAHEWLHALDRYFSNFDENALYPNGVRYATGKEYAENTRQEIKDAFEKIMSGVRGGEYQKRSARLGDYWASDKELAARALQDYMMRKLDERGQKNDFLSNHVAPEDWAGDMNNYPFPLGAEADRIAEAFDNFFATVEEKTEDGQTVLFQQGMIELDRENPAFERATENVRKKLEATGVKVKVLTKEEAESELARLEELADMQKRTAPETESVQDEHQPSVVSSAGKRKSPETALPEDESSFKGTAISSDDGAKILKDIDSAIAKYENSNDRAETFIGNVAKALGIDAKDKSSKYATFEAKNGVIFTIRISNHNATVSNFDNAGEGNGISIVISRKPNEGITNDGNAHLVEFFYPEKKISKADGKPLVEILKSIKQALYSGEYKDNTGLAQPEEVNIPEFLRTSDGTTYGWAVNGEIYLTPEGLNPNTPIHEYTHLWAAALQKSNPKLWGEVVEAMKLSPAWNEVMADENYTDIHGDENRVASEVLSRLSGNEGYRRYMEQAEAEIAAEKNLGEKVRKKGILNRIRNAVSRFWNWLKGKLGSKAKAGDGTEAKAEPWDVFVNKSLKDFDEGVNPDAKDSPLDWMFIGKKGAANLDKAEEATTRLDNLAVAREMETGGKDAKAIKLATGWERGADGKWRYETEDLINVEAVKKLAAAANSQGILSMGVNTNLKSILKQGNNLLVAYPELSDMKVVFKQMGAYDGYYDKANNTLAISSSILRKENKIAEALEKAKAELEHWETMDDAGKELASFMEVDYAEHLKKLKNNVLELEKAQKELPSLIADELNGIAVHEIQHAIQHIEGFATGGNENTADWLNEKSKVWTWKKALDRLAEERPDIAGTVELEKALVEEYKAEGLASYIPTEEQRIKGFNLYARGYDNEGYESAYNESIKAAGKSDRGVYNDLAGEVEARSAQKRMNYTEEQRRNELATETEDVSRKDQIFILDNLGVSASETLFSKKELTPEQKKKQEALKENAKAIRRLHNVKANYPITALRNLGFALETQEQRDEHDRLFAERDAITGKSKPAETNPQSMTLQERITESLLKQAEQEKENVEMRLSAIRAYGRDLANVIKLMNAQKGYDRNTVRMFTDLVKMCLRNNAMDGMSSYEISRLLNLMQRATGGREKTVNGAAVKIAEIITGAHTKQLNDIMEKQIKTGREKVNASGVVVQGGVDIIGKRVLNTYRDAIKVATEEDFKKRYDAAFARVGDLQKSIENAKNAGKDTKALENLLKEAQADADAMLLAANYRNEIKAVEEDIEALKSELSGKRDALAKGEITRNEYYESAKSINSQIVQMRAQQIDAYQKVLHALSGDIYEGVQRARAFREAEAMRVQRIHDMAENDMGGVTKSAERKEPGVVGKTVDMMVYKNPLTRAVMHGLGTYENYMKYFGRDHLDGRGELFEYFMTAFNQAQDKEWKESQNDFNILEAAAQKIFGEKKVGKRYKDIARNSTKGSGVILSYWNGGAKVERELTIGQLMYLYMTEKQAEGQMKLRNMGLTEEKVQNAVAKLPAKYKAFADYIQTSFLPEMRPRMNEVHQRMFGASMSEVENYFPLKVNQDARKGDTDLNNTGDAIPSTITGAVIKRRVNVTPIDLTANAFDVLNEHIVDMEHWAAFAEFTRDNNTLINDNDFKNRVKNTKSVRHGDGETLWKDFVETAKITTGNYQQRRDYIAKLMSGANAAKITFGYYTALKQLSSLPAFLADANAIDLVWNTAKAYGSWQWAIKNLPGFEERWKGRTGGNERLGENEYSIHDSRIMKAARMAGMTPNAFIDAVVVASGARAVYETRLRFYKKLGMTEYEADRRAKNDAAISYNETQQSGQGAYLSRLQKEGGIAALLTTLFRNSQMAFQRRVVGSLVNTGKKLARGERIREATKRKYMQMGMDEAAAEKRATKEFYKSYAKDITNLAIFGYGMNFLWVLMGQLPYLLFGDDDEEKEKIYDQAKKVGVTGMFEGFTLGNVAKAYYENKVNGTDYAVSLLEAPFEQDLDMVLSRFEKDGTMAGILQLGVFLTEMNTGISPQRLIDDLAAVIDLCDGDVELANDGTLFALRMLKAPQSQQDMLILDELEGADAERVKKVAEKFIEYKMTRNFPFGSEDEKRVDKYANKFVETLKERVEKDYDPEDISVIYDRSSDTEKEILKKKWVEEMDKRNGTNAAKSLRKEKIEELLGSPVEKAAAKALHRFTKTNSYEKMETFDDLERWYEYDVLLDVFKKDYQRIRDEEEMTPEERAKAVEHYGVYADKGFKEVINAIKAHKKLIKENNDPEWRMGEIRRLTDIATDIMKRYE